MVLVVKSLSANVDEKDMASIRSLGLEDPLEEKMATHSGILAWRIPWRGLSGYSSWDHKELDMTK